MMPGGDMTEAESKADPVFISLVLSIQMAAMQQMGKVASPITGKVERDLNQCRASIDMLEMISRKTKGNLEPDEEKIINNVLYELRMNYMDEANKPAAESSEEEDKSKDESIEKQEREQTDDEVAKNDNDEKS
jgi:hypothetical protein